MFVINESNLKSQVHIVYLVVAAAELLSLHLSRGCDRPRVDGVGEKHWR